MSDDGKHGFASAGEWLRAVKAAHDGGTPDPRLVPLDLSPLFAVLEAYGQTPPPRRDANGKSVRPHLAGSRRPPHH
jgi:hypothetical protein